MNVVQLQKQLQMMPDQSLATYMQRPDGTVPQYLVLSELNRRKKLRDSAASMAQGAEAPRTTVKEDVEQGIQALPAASPGAQQAYASGGLVSFASGGDVDDRSNRNPYSVIQQRAASNPLGNLQANYTALSPTSGSPFADISNLIGYHTQPTDYSADADAGPQIEPYNAQPLVAPGFTARAAAQAAQSAAQNPSVPSSVPSQRAPAGGLGSLAVSGRTKTAGKAPAGVAVDGTQYKETSDEDRIASVKKWQDFFKQQNEGEFDEAKQRLEDARSEIAGRKQDNINQAMIQAGLAIMGGKSQYALTNIGEGGLKGLEYYQKAQASDDAAKKALVSEQNSLTAAQASARRGDQQSAIAFQGQAEKDRQFAVTAQQQRENYLLAHQDRMAQINATLQAASMRMTAGQGTKQDTLALKAAQMAEGSAKAWAATNKSNPQYVIDPDAFERDYQAKLAEGYTRAYAVIGRQMPDAVSAAPAPQATMQWDPKSKKLVPIQ